MKKSKRKKSLQAGAGRKKAPPRFELGLLDSKSNVVTTRLWGQMCFKLECNFIYIEKIFFGFAVLIDEAFFESLYAGTEYMVPGWEFSRSDLLQAVKIS